jgi:transcription elongation GreA/GreB family factor
MNFSAISGWRRLLGRVVGEVVEVRTKNGTRRLTILEVLP